MNPHDSVQVNLWGDEGQRATSIKVKRTRVSKGAGPAGPLPEKLGKAIRLPVPDFSDPNRKPTCLEIDFPIAQINALSNLEGNAGKPIYQMSKWWARRRSSVFRSMLIAAATEAPKDPSEAAKLVWEHYYCNHQKAGSFRKLKVLDCFMGGGTTLVEGSRLGMQMTGVDLNPVAWFVVKNELACSDPEQVKALFEHIEDIVKPQVQPFYTTTCPRGHRGRWIDNESGNAVDVDPIRLAPEQRSRYRWQGPEVIYTFWAKHGPCQATGCGHRTPIFKTPVVAEKKLTTYFIPIKCPSCSHSFGAELGETRMAPAAERVVLENEPSFTKMTQGFARRLKEYSHGTGPEKAQRVSELLEMLPSEQSLCCPKCRTYSGDKLQAVLERHSRTGSASGIRKSELGIESRPVYMYLLVNPAWLRGSAGNDDGVELGGYAGASANLTAKWFTARLNNLSLIEVRGRIKLADDGSPEPDEDDAVETVEVGDEGADEKDRKKYGLPREIVLQDGTRIDTRRGTVPEKSYFSCGSCGLGGKDKLSQKNNSTLSAVKQTGHTAPVAAYALQCHCPQCDVEGYQYGGRYFKAVDMYDSERLAEAEREWQVRMETDLSGYWPREGLLYAHMTHERNPLPDHGYTHWWMFFNSRQLLIHATLLKAIAEAPEDTWPLDVREQVLGAFQQYLRNQNMFCFWDIGYDKLVPFMSNANFNPKNLWVENNYVNPLGRGNWSSCVSTVISGLQWCASPWEASVGQSGSGRSAKLLTEDPVIPGNEPLCGSSTDLGGFGNNIFDLVITDPPFGDNLYYADLADFFYVWLRIPLRRWYSGLAEAAYFQPERTPHSMEAIDNAVEHPDERGPHEKDPFIDAKHLARIRELTEDAALCEKDPNPLYRPTPASDFYSQTLSAVWAEAGRRLRDGGLMAFTFHHSEDQAWIDILKALFDAGYTLVATYPIRSDESKGEGGAFGSKKIEYDIIHVCRKRLKDPEPVSWARMRRWVKEESARLKDLLEHTHGKELPESDLRVILRGKSLEFYSRHYGQVYTGDGQVLDVRNALLGINLLLDDLLETSVHGTGLRPPDGAEPASRLYLRLFKERAEIDRDELHKTLRGTGIAQGDLESRGWIRSVGRAVHVVPITERMAFFTERGRNRKVIRTDLDQAHFLIGAAFPDSGLKIDVELDNQNLRVKRSVDEILHWFAEVSGDPAERLAARTAHQLVVRWRTRSDRPQVVQQTLFDLLEEADR